MKILIAEDDLNTRNGLTQIMSDEGYEVVVAENGIVAMELFVSESPDAVCLDVMMPGADGYAVCRELRKKDARVPILFISAKSEEIDKVLGLELGADDFIVKPFGVKEVVARIRAVTRRCFAQREREGEQGSEDDVFQMADLKVVPAELRVYRDGKGIEISLRDMKILKMLFLNSGKALKRDSILDECWGIDYFPNSRALDQHVSQLRKRIEKDPAAPEIIRTVHGVGYRFEG
ncbi:response regulator transcription factor [bacterium]|nr:response regulator transcription factor [bacterium]